MFGHPDMGVPVLKPDLILSHDQVQNWCRYHAALAGWFHDLDGFDCRQNAVFRVFSDLSVCVRLSLRARHQINLPCGLCFCGGECGDGPALSRYDELLLPIVCAVHLGCLWASQ